MNYKEYKSPSFMEAYKNAFKSIFDFDGRSRRAEYWKFLGMYYLFAIIIFAISGILSYISDTFFAIGLVILVIYYIVHLLPSISILVRRLHDSGHTAKWLFGTLIPYLGFLFCIPIIIFIFQDSEEEFNNWGESTKYYTDND